MHKLALWLLLLPVASQAQLPMQPAPVEMDAVAKTVAALPWSCAGVGDADIVPGTGYKPDIYENMPLSGGTGTGAKATITVSAQGVVADVVFTSVGQGYKAHDTLTAALPDGTGFALSVARVQDTHPAMALFKDPRALKAWMRLHPDDCPARP